MKTFLERKNKKGSSKMEPKHYRRTNSPPKTMKLFSRHNQKKYILPHDLIEHLRHQIYHLFKHPFLLVRRVIVG